MSEQIEAYLGSLLRTSLTPLVMYLSAKGYISESEAVQLAAIGASFTVALGLSFFNKYIWAKKVDTALELPGGSSHETLNDVLTKK